MDLIDIGANLTGSSFSNDLADVITRAQQAGVNKMLVTGTDIQHSKDAIHLCAEYADMLTSTAGVHPHHADDFDASSVEQLAEVAEQACVVAVGECGLDYNRNFSRPRAQRFAFEQQLELAMVSGKPVFLHQRDAHDDFLAMMANAMPELKGGVAHCFTGTPAQAEAYLDIGLYIGVTGWICDERRAHDLQQAVKVIPLDRLLLETDAPYLLPRDLSLPIAECQDYTPDDRRRNEPCFLPHVCRAVAAFMGEDEVMLAQASTDNAVSLFNI
jgi:TatD DNase family protein